MDTLKFFFPFPFLFLFLSPLIHATNSCATSICFNSSFTIRFPFQTNQQQPQTCGYPGFDLTCNNQGTTVLNLPNSGKFFVRYINYLTQQIQLYDPNNCLPTRLLEFNLTGSPFRALYYLNYTFLTCPSKFTRSRFTVIDCLSDSTNTTLATSSMNLAMGINVCEILVTLPIPVSRPSQDEDDFSSDLSDDLVLTWDVPNCEECESKGAMCGLQDNASQQIVCINNPGTGKANRLRVFQIICFSIVVPTITCAFATAFFIYFVSGGTQRRRNGTTTVQQNSDPAAITPQPTTIIAGLDESTIESYTKVVLGESRRLPGPNDDTCSICLSEYRAKEMVRCIPACKHCFHADCIDEWLRLNGTCPVCRNSPTPAHGNLENV
ncbi:hypothetical protein CsSME_00013015 [Camellia sinensis var. sinensis]